MFSLFGYYEYAAVNMSIRFHMDIFSVLLGVFLGVKLLSHIVTVHLTLRGTARLFSTATAPTLHSCPQQLRVPLSPHRSCAFFKKPLRVMTVY